MAAKIDEFLLRQFEREVERQCQFAMIALQDMEESSANGDGKLFWYSVQGFMVAVWKASSMLWPEEPRFADRGPALRDSLGVGGDSPLRDRAFIERFERYDTRLEEWQETSDQHRFFDSYTEPLDVLAETHMGDRFRGYDLENEALLFGGEPYYLKPVAEAVESLAQAAQLQMNKPRFNIHPDAG